MPSSLEQSEGGGWASAEQGGAEGEACPEGHMAGSAQLQRGYCRGMSPYPVPRAKFSWSFSKVGGLYPLGAGKQTPGSRRPQVQPSPTSDWLCALGLLICKGMYYPQALSGAGWGWGVKSKGK